MSGEISNQQFALEVQEECNTLASIRRMKVLQSVMIFNVYLEYDAMRTLANSKCIRTHS